MVGPAALAAAGLFRGILIHLWLDDAQGADLGAGVQWVAGASLWNPNAWPSPGREAGHREGCELPTGPGWLPGDLGHQSSGPTFCLSQARVPVGFFFFKHECLWGNLHIGTISYLHLWLFTKPQNCTEVREPRGCQDALGEVVSRLLVAPFGGPWGGGTWSGSSPYRATRHSGSLHSGRSPGCSACVLSRSPTPCTAGGAHHCAGSSVPGPRLAPRPGAQAPFCSPPLAAQ